MQKIEKLARVAQAAGALGLTRLERRVLPGEWGGVSWVFSDSRGRVGWMVTEVGLRVEPLSENLAALERFVAQARAEGKL
jgi:hypothetical protein